VDKKSKAQIFLERVEMYDTIIENKLIEKQQWHELAMSITAHMDGERVQSSGSKSKMADAVIKCLAVEDEIADAVDTLIEKKQKVVGTIEKLYSPIEYDLLHKRYIQHIALTDIADHYGKEYSWVTTTHGRALKSVENILKKEG
jgi:hypothetical protein